MAISRQKKEDILERYTGDLARAQVMIWCSQLGLSVAQITDLRRRLRPVGGEAVVVKNSLLRMALEQAGLPYDEQMMAGPNVVTFVEGDIQAATKAIADFAREHDAVFQIKGGMMSGSVMSAEQVRALTTLPSREELLARVVGGVQAPISGFVFVLSGVLRSVMNVLNARAQQLEGSSS